jgi:uncharacterized protein (TIGR04141 family)
LKKANEKISELTENQSFVIPTDINSITISVVYGIIKEKDEGLPQIPFFSMVTLKHVKNRLNALGIDVSIKTIVKDPKPKS